jgi:hypothetical protein
MELDQPVDGFCTAVLRAGVEVAAKFVPPGSPRQAEPCDFRDRTGGGERVQDPFSERAPVAGARLGQQAQLPRAVPGGLNGEEP